MSRMNIFKKVISWMGMASLKVKVLAPPIKTLALPTAVLLELLPSRRATALAITPLLHKMRQAEAYNP